VGKVTNKGFETTLEYKDMIGNFSYWLTGMVSHNSNKADYMAEVVTVPSAAYTGKELGVLMGYLADGFYDISDFDANGDLKDGIPSPTFGPIQPGDVKYKNLNRDDVIDENDQAKIGNSSRPKWVYSLKVNLGYRGFDFFALLQGADGRDVNLLNAPLQVIAFRDNGNIYSIANERWTYYPEKGLDTRQTASYPRLSTQDNSNNYRNSTLWVKNGDYLRLRNVELGYTFTQLKKIGISNLRLYFSGVNLFTWSKLMKDYNMDPEVLSGHPAMKSYNIGITINF
jgi:hypothetical protein